MKHFWNDLSYWERDKSIESALGFIDLYQRYDKLSDEQKIKTENFRVECDNLKNTNANARPSKLSLILHKFLKIPYADECKPNARQCLAIAYTLSKEEHINLCSYLGINDIENIIQENRIYDLYLRIAETGSMARFFAFSNYLGKM
ncbi:hypothetical protein V7O66_02970 [Methanolobus sp. ZRKC3]|uniref:hypothetical protein n=1 Tax=Methanolobus sp. ZRKC3 TaxID=3125786 RepID=UPI00324AB389